MTVFECFPCCAEIELLELHLAETDPVVDQWVICELPVTFTGVAKPMALERALLDGRLDRWRGKIRRLAPSSVPAGPHPTVDWFQRRTLSRGIPDARADDLIILTDLDEIPRCAVIEALRASPPLWPVVLNTTLYYFTVNWRSTIRWNGPIVTPRGCLGESMDLQRLRDQRNSLPIIGAGGWHFSWLGSVDDILAKLEAVDIDRESAIYGAGGIVAPVGGREFVDDCRREGLDLFRRVDVPLTWVPVTAGASHPTDIVDWLARYPRHTSPPPPPTTYR